MIRPSAMRLLQLGVCLLGVMGCGETTLSPYTPRDAGGVRVVLLFGDDFFGEEATVVSALWPDPLGFDFVEVQEGSFILSFPSVPIEYASQQVTVSVYFDLDNNGFCEAEFDAPGLLIVQPHLEGNFLVANVTPADWFPVDNCNDF